MEGFYAIEDCCDGVKVYYFDGKNTRVRRLIEMYKSIGFEVDYLGT